MYPASSLRIERTKLGIPLSQMAYDLKINLATLSLIERGHADKPDVRKAMRHYLATRQAATSTANTSGGRR
jgi:cytoskeletal protein RodZ